MAVSFKNEISLKFLSHLMIRSFFTGNLLLSNLLPCNKFPVFKFQKFTNTYLGKVTKCQFNCFSRFGAAFKKPEDAAPSSIRVKISQVYLSLTFQLSQTAVVKVEIQFYFPDRSGFNELQRS